MPTTTFCDVKFTEDVENYNYENKDRSFQKGDIVSLPRHTAQKFVNSWSRAEWAKPPYEVRDDEYDDIVCRIRNREDQSVKNNDLPEDFDPVEDAVTPQEWLEMRTVEQLKDEISDFEESQGSIGFLNSMLHAADRKGAKEAIEQRLEELEQ